MASTAEAPANAGGPTQHTQNQDTPSVYQLMALVMRDVKNVGKNGRNASQNYSFRGVDDAIGALAQPLRDHGVFMTPEVLDCQSEVRGKMNAVRMRVAFHFYGPAGDRVTAVTMGEAADVADKASNKAMSAALKYALVHTFMIPVDAGSLDDGDRDTPVGRQSPADVLMERLRKPYVWHNRTALVAMHTEAKAEGLLDAVVEGPDGETKLGELLVVRGTQLKAEEEEREARRAQERPEVAAQVAAEHGVKPAPEAAPAAPPTSRSVPQQRAQERPEPAGRPQQEQPGQPPVDADLDRLLGQAQTHWSNRTVLEQVRAELDVKGLAAAEVQGPDGAWQGFGALLDARIGAMAAAGQDRGAA